MQALPLPGQQPLWIQATMLNGPPWLNKVLVYFTLPNYNIFTYRQEPKVIEFCRVPS